MIEETSNSKAQLDNGVRKFYFNLITAAFFSMRKKKCFNSPLGKKIACFLSTKPTSWIQKSIKRSIKSYPYLHVIILTFRFNIFKLTELIGWYLIKYDLANLTLNSCVVVAISPVVIAIPKFWSPRFQIISTIQLRRNRLGWASQRVHRNITICVW